jgi:glycosyltransferase involved in cell wall biosynthesis
MRVSIAMATYNGAQYLEEQLDSFVAQDRQPDELVICDDASTDATMAIVEEFAARAPFTVVAERNPRNLGYTPNFSKAASLCSGDVIFLSDQDDLWYPAKIETALSALRNGVHVVLNDQEIRHSDGTTSGTILHNMRALGCSDSMFVAGCCTAMSRTYAQLVLPFDEKLAFDHWVSVFADLLGIRLVIDEPLQLYRRHGGNTSQSVFAGRSPTQFDVFRRYGVNDPRTAWKEQIDYCRRYAQRLREQRDIAIALSTPEAVDAALARIKREAGAFEKRLAVLAHPRWARPVHVLRFWREGNYEEFEGWKSACKDLVRP